VISRRVSADLVRVRIDGSSLGGMWANQQLFETAANNVANVNSEDFRDRPVELAEEFPAMTVAQVGYTASARVLRTQDELSGYLIDVLAR
jgi:flagellar hook protein FlgE